MKKIIVAAFILSTGFAAVAQKKTKSPIEGRIYSVVLTPQGEKKAEPSKDEVGFVTGPKMKSSFMFTAGFPQCDYDYEVDSTSGTKIYKFTAEAKKDDTQERFSWEASLQGDDISGTAVIRKKGKVQHTYDITGTWKNKKKVKPAPKASPAAAPDSTATGTGG